MKTALTARPFNLWWWNLAKLTLLYEQLNILNWNFNLDVHYFSAPWCSVRWGYKNFCKEHKKLYKYSITCTAAVLSRYLLADMESPLKHRSNWWSGGGKTNNTAITTIHKMSLDASVISEIFQSQGFMAFLFLLYINTFFQKNLHCEMVTPLLVSSSHWVTYQCKMWFSLTRPSGPGQS